MRCCVTFPKTYVDQYRPIPSLIPRYICIHDWLSTSWYRLVAFDILTSHWNRREFIRARALCFNFYKNASRLKMHKANRKEHARLDVKSVKTEYSRRMQLRNLLNTEIIKTFAMVPFAFKYSSFKFELFKHRICIYIFCRFRKAYSIAKLVKASHQKHRINAFDANIPQICICYIFLFKSGKNIMPLFQGNALANKKFFSC